MSRISGKSNLKCITCFLPKGQSARLLEPLLDKGLTRASVVSARGFAVGAESKKGRLPVQEENEFLSVIVRAEQAEEIFDFLYYEAKIGEPNGGLMILGPVSLAVPYVIE